MAVRECRQEPVEENPYAPFTWRRRSSLNRWKSTEEIGNVPLDNHNRSPIVVDGRWIFCLRYGISKIANMIIDRNPYCNRRRREDFGPDMCDGTKVFIFVYFLSLFLMPVAIVKRLESLRSSFFWGGSETSRKLAWVKWDRVMAKRDSGGLGIGSLVSFVSGTASLWENILVNMVSELIR
ncbi:hypothetical protein LXL04_000005 [Taraxacum kok-saghyz]